MIKKDDGLVET